MPKRRRKWGTGRNTQETYHNLLEIWWLSIKHVTGLEIILDHSDGTCWIQEQHEREVKLLELEQAYDRTVP